MRYIKFTYWIFFCLLAASCTEDLIEEEILHVDRPGPSVLVESGCFGTTVDQRGNRLRDVVVRAGDDICISGPDGIFDLGNVFMHEDAQVLTAQSNQSAPYIRLLNAELGALYYEHFEFCDFRVISQSEQPGVHNDEHFTYKYTNGTFLQNRELYSGPIVFALHRYPLTGDDALVQAPIPLFDNWEGQNRLFQPVELFYMEWQGDSGQDLDIAQNHELQVSGTVSSAFFDSNGDYQFYYWSNEKKAWMHHPKMELINQTFEADIHRSTWWMIAETTNAEKYTLHLRNDQGPFAFQEIFINDSSGEKRGPFYTDARGQLALFLKPDQDYRVDLMDWCGKMMDALWIKTTQTNIHSEPSEDILLWKGNVMNCDGNAASNSLLVLDPRGERIPVRPDAAGYFSVALNNCPDAEIFTVEAHDGAQKNRLLFSKRLISSGNLDSLWICNQSGFGGHLDWRGKIISIDSSLSCEIKLNPMKIELSFKILGLEQLIEITEIRDTSVIGFAQGDLFSSGLHQYPIEFHVLQIGKYPGDRFIAEFEGDLQFNGENGPTTIEGKLNARIRDIN